MGTPFLGFRVPGFELNQCDPGHAPAYHPACCQQEAPPQLRPSSADPQLPNPIFDDEEMLDGLSSAAASCPALSDEEDPGGERPLVRCGMLWHGAAPVIPSQHCRHCVVQQRCWPRKTLVVSGRSCAAACCGTARRQCHPASTARTSCEGTDWPCCRCCIDCRLRHTSGVSGPACCAQPAGKVRWWETCTRMQAAPGRRAAPGSRLQLHARCSIGLLQKPAPAGALLLPVNWTWSVLQPVLQLPV